MTDIRLVDFSSLEKEISSLKTDLLLVVTEEKIWSLYKEKLLFLSPGEKGKLPGKAILFWVGPSGEEIKSFRYYQECSQFFLNQGVHRKAHLLAIGGGALSDMAGFVAATLLRGISWSVVPTTLLSMVDAAIGGKVAINTEAGKNLLGAFHLPQNVWIHRDFCFTLPRRELQNGLGEILKYAFLCPEIFKTLLEGEGQGEPDLSFLIPKCAQFKQEVVERDFLETGERMFLNLGHTFGHAFEKVLGLAHGEAVILGLEFILKFFPFRPANSKLQEAFGQLKERLGVDRDLNLNHHFPRVDKELFLSFVLKDKKRMDREQVNLVLLKDIGRPYLETVPVGKIRQVMEGKEDNACERR